MSLKKQAKNIQRVGFKNSGQDSMLAHISPLEAMMLKAHGGSGRTDPKTGLPHFDDWGGGYGGSVGGGDGGNSGGDGDTGTSYGDQPGDYDMPSDPSSQGLDLSNIYGDFTPSDQFEQQAGLSWGAPEDTNPYGAKTSPDEWGHSLENDWFSRLKNFLGMQAQNKAMSSLAQAVPGLNMALPSLSNAAHAYANDQDIGKAVAAGMVDTIAAPVQGPVQALVGLANLFGANLNVPTMGQSLANANLDYKGLSPGTSGFGTSTTGQQGTGGSGLNFDNVLNGVGTLAGLYSQYRNGSQNNKQANNLASMFGPNSPYAQQLKTSLERRDAARGRRSQYGPREVELQAKLAQMASGVAPSILAARNAGNTNMMNMLGMLTSANKMGVFDPVKGWLGDMFKNNTGGFTMPDTPYSTEYTPSTNYFDPGWGF